MSDPFRRLETPRRHVQQAKHNIEAALSVIERNEDPRCAVDDLNRAIQLLKKALPTLRSIAKGYNRGMKGS